jgi:hypothetical protein
LPASPRHNRQLLDGQAEWRPFRPYEPEQEAAAAEAEGDADSASGTEEAEADIREMLDEYNDLLATGTIEDLLEFYADEHHDALRPVLEAASAAAKKVEELRAALEAQAPDEQDAINAALDTLQAAAHFAVNIDEVKFTSEALATGAGLAVDPRITYRFPLVDDYWFIEIAEPTDLTQVKTALDANLGTYTGWLETVQADPSGVAQVLAQIEAAAPAEPTRDRPAGDSEAEPEETTGGAGSAEPEANTGGG